MSVDVPIVVYKRNKRDKGHTREDMDKLAEAWSKRKKVVVGKKISLGDLLGGGKVEKYDPCAENNA